MYYSLQAVHCAIPTAYLMYIISGTSVPLYKLSAQQSRFCNMIFASALILFH